MTAGSAEQEQPADATEPEPETGPEPLSDAAVAVADASEEQAKSEVPIESVGAPQSLNQAAQWILRGGDITPVQPITIRAFNRRLLDGENTASREPAAANGEDPVRSGNSRATGRREPEQRTALPEQSNAESSADFGTDLHQPTSSMQAARTGEHSQAQATPRITALQARTDAKQGSTDGAAAAPNVSPISPATGSAASATVRASGVQSVPGSADNAASSFNSLRGLLAGAGANGSSTKLDGGARAEGGEFRRQLVAQVSRGLTAAIAKRDAAGASSGATETVVLKLRPETLGQVKVTLEWKDAAPGDRQPGLTASFEVHSKQTQSVLASAIDQLRTSLESRGLRVQNVEVKLAKVAVPDPLRALGERPAWTSDPANPESTPPGAHDAGFAAHDQPAGQHEGAWSGGGGSGGGWAGLAGGWAAGWNELPAEAVETAIGMVPGLLGDPGGETAASVRSTVLMGVDTIA